LIDFNHILMNPFQFASCFVSRICPAIFLLAASGGGLTAGEPGGGGVRDPEGSLERWWGGKGLTGDWFGLRGALDDRGLTMNGRYYGAYFGVVSSEGGSRGFWDQGLEFGAAQDFGKLLGAGTMSGVRAFAGFRWRDARSAADPNTFVEASSMFNPSNWISGVQFRVLNFGLELASAERFVAKDLFVLRLGWLQPQKEFADQPLSKLFLNNAVNSAKGIGGNIPFSSSASTWGGSLRVRPAPWYYAKGALFMAYPKMTDSNNHGLAFGGFAADPSKNGLWGMAETGVTPEIGPSQLPGRYAVGGYYYGGEKNSFNGTGGYGQFGFYWQADQMLFRERTASAAPVRSGAAEGKSFKAPADLPAGKRDDQGLSMFNLLSFAPKYNNTFPFYFQTGLVYKGLLPERDRDLAMVSLACGNYSYYKLLEDRENGRATAAYTVFLEWGYRFQINAWAFVQPFAQYVIRPDGTGETANATILGISTGVTF
jgi:porin